MKAVLSRRRRAAADERLNQLPVLKYYALLKRILLQNKSIKNYWTKALKLSMKETDSSIKVH